MTPKTTQHQQVLPEIGEALAQEEVARQKLVAFGGFVKAEIYDVFSEYDLSDLTKEEKQWVSADKFREVLFGAQKSSHLSVDNVTFNSYEYSLVVRNPEALGRTAVSRTLGANDIDDERMAASKRAQTHVLGGKAEQMQDHLTKMRQRRADIKELQKEVRTPGYAHKTPDRMKELIGETWLELNIILDVLHVKRGWDDNQRTRAEAAVIHYLTQGPQRDRVSHWSSMLSLVDNYLGARINIFSNRVRKTERILEAESA